MPKKRPKRWLQLHKAVHMTGEYLSTVTVIDLGREKMQDPCSIGKWYETNRYLLQRNVRFGRKVEVFHDIDIDLLKASLNPKSLVEAELNFIASSLHKPEWLRKKTLY